MALEIEKKYRLTGEQFAALGEALAEYAEQYAGEDFEENVIYGGGALDEKQATLRIRRTDGGATFTLKQRIGGSGGVKHQIEHETSVADADALAAIVAELGFEPRLVYEKRRRSWKFPRAEVVLDELPFGLFMEIEGSLTSIAEMEMLLGAEDLEAVHETYPALTWRLGTRRGSRVEARFEEDKCSNRS
jgi:adenylate cyclase class 2